jgi:hypothetical protein
MFEKQDHIHEHVEQVHNKYHQLVARAWDDLEFKDRLLADPGAVFQEHGIELPRGVEVRVYENTAQAWHFVLPAKVTDLSDDVLRAGEMAEDCVCTCCCGYTLALDRQLGQVFPTGQ